jgi:DNA-binding transcriptional LysR family regulator
MCTIKEGNRPMDHLQAIRIFARVVETGSFTRAALSLDMPNTTVSKWVRSLEAHLGVKLLERSTRRVTVTTDGAAYYERTRFLLSELDDVEATLGRAHGSPRGALRIDTGGSVASNILIPALPSFRATYPDIQLLLSVTDRTADLIAENIDCAVRSTANDPALVTQRVGTLRWATIHGRSSMTAIRWSGTFRQAVVLSTRLDSHAVPNGSPWTVCATTSWSAKATRILRLRLQVSASSRHSNSWGSRRSRAANSFPSSPSGIPSRSTFMSRIRRAVDSARKCWYSSIGLKRSSLRWVPRVVLDPTLGN